MSDPTSGLARFFQPPQPPTPTKPDDLTRIADALERIADAMTPADAPSDEYERGRADERGGVAPVHFLAEIRYRAWRCSCGHVAESHLDLVAHVKATR